MDHILMVLSVSLWSSGLWAEDTNNHNEPVRLVGGSSRCAGTLEVKQSGQWKPVYDNEWTLKHAAPFCRELDCGSAVSTRWRKESSDRPIWTMNSDCFYSRSRLGYCLTADSSSYILEITCSDSVRLVNGTSLCSGRLEVMSNQSNQSTQSWSSVCDADFDQQDAEVVCRELGCGAPSVLQGALYGDVEASMWTKEFQCGGTESALLDCRSSGSERNTCSPGKAVGLTCSEPVRLVGGSSRCSGTLEVKQGEWRQLYDFYWTLKDAADFCRELECGSAVSVGRRKVSSDRLVWTMTHVCVRLGSALRDCVSPESSPYIVEVTCSDLLVQPNISVSSSMDGVSEAQQQGFQVPRGSTFTISCSIQPQYPGGSFQLNFTSSTSAFTYTQPAVNHSAHFLFPAAEPAHQGSYSCVYHVYVLSHNFSSESRRLPLTVENVKPIRRGRCAGTLEVKQSGQWKPVYDNEWTLKHAAPFCRELDCGSAVSTRWRKESSDRPIWTMNSDCFYSRSRLGYCLTADSSSYILEITCSDSVRLVNGTSLCSGRLDVMSNQSNQSTQSWSSVCDADFDQQDAEVVCRELGCGAPSVLQGALYGDVEASMWTKEFQCGGTESALLDCRSSGSERNTCSPGKAVGLTCSEPVRLVGGSSRCSGTLEVKQGEWRQLYDFYWTLKDAADFCRELECGSAVSVGRRKVSSDRLVWTMTHVCVRLGSALRDCVSPESSPYIVEVTCSDPLVQPV